MINIKILENDLIKKVIAIILVIMSILNLIITIIVPARADSLLGTNLALGSPVLNSKAVSDDWNKYESLVWGIYLSNFCIPFVDDYESAFNLESTSGSSGRGLKALNFGSGSDPENSKVLKELVSYGINMQKMNMRKLYVSYNLTIDNKLEIKNAFEHNTDTPDNSVTEITEGSISVGNLSGNLSAPREAKLEDLFLKSVYIDDVESAGNTYSWAAVNNTSINWESVGKTIASYTTVGAIMGGGAIGATAGAVGSIGTSIADNIYNQFHKYELIHEDDNYPDFRGIRTHNLPTFAITKANSAGSGYEIAFDLTDSYDYEMLIGSICYALKSDYSSDALKSMFTGDEIRDAALYLDSFGNICADINGRYIIIIPASANQYLTKEKSINLLNSLVFNAGTRSNSIDTMISDAGAYGVRTSAIFGKLTTKESLQSGGLAFNNESLRTKNGGMALFYDTDNIVFQKLLENPNYKVNTGEIIKELMDANITDKNSKYNLKIEPINIGAMLSTVSGDKVNEILATTIVTSSSISNMSQNSKNREINSVLKMTNGTEDIKLFEKSYLISVNCPEGQEENGKYNSFEVYRNIPNFMYNHKSDVISNGVLDKTTPSDMMDAFTLSKLSDSTNEYTFANTAVSFMREMVSSGLYKINESTGIADNSSKNFSRFEMQLGNKGASAIALKNIKIGTIITDLDDKNNKDSYLYNRGNYIYSTSNNPINKFFGIDELSDDQLSLLTFGRLIKVYLASPELESVSSILSIKDGVDLSVFSTHLYYTYLTWFGVSKNKLTGLVTAEINNNLLPEDAAKENFNDANLKSKEDLEREVLNYSYLTLHPTAGREYRNDIVMSKISSAIYNEYEKIVYGGSDTYYYSSVTTRNNTGFLAVENYTENFLTAPFIKIYATVAIFIISIGCILTVLIGIIKHRKISWVILGMFAIVTVTLVLPSTGEIVPYTANNIVQDLFKDKMTFWNISEQASNIQNYKSVYGTNGQDDSDDQLINSLVRSTKSLYLDRYLSLRQDISNKVTNKMADEFKNIQSMKSVRWMLPTIIREYTNSSGSADYVYVPVGDKLDDCSNLYFIYNNAYVNYSESVTKDMVNSNGVISIPEINKSDKSILGNFKALGEINKYYGGFYNLTYDGLDSHDETHFRANSLSKNIDNNKSHTYFYIIDNSMMTDSDGMNDIDVANADLSKPFREWVIEYKSYLEGNKSLTDGIKDSYNGSGANYLKILNGVYDRYSWDTTNSRYGFMWMTENPLHYFYHNVLDSFDMDYNMGSIANALQGSYVNAENGKEYRATLMRSSKNGEVKDFLDLENLFTNAIPYMYSMQVLAGGYDGEGGVFGDELIGNSFKTHSKERISWLYRSNWVTKLMENDQYNSSTTIRDGNGETYKVANMLLPQCYPGYYDTTCDRVMVFSRAQMVELGLNDGDLSLVEQKCVKLNEDMERKWTLLLNYLSVSGVNKEVLFRQMALDSTLEFNSAFSSYGVLRSNHKLYPTSLDLRSISFDSVMKLIILNVTHNSAYIYGDSMDVMIDESDIVTQITLLVLAVMCVYIVPLIRKILIGFIFYLGFVVVLKELFRDPREKVQSSIGYMGCNILSLLLNVGYLLAIRLLINMTVSDQIIEVSSEGINTGSPMICFIIILIISIIYVVSALRILGFCFRNWQDMGYSAFKGVVEMTAAGISSGFEGILAKMGEESAVNDSANTGNSGAIPDPVNQTSQVTDNQTTSYESNIENDVYEINRNTRYGDNIFMDSDVDEINATIERGSMVDSDI